ncbi:MAG: hypothetical protein LN415_03505 [Candidatus Thermoplasmatota archaeon]|nr:hypothetical protein [Candidatus Thermoplasmatota archaeon]
MRRNGSMFTVVLMAVLLLGSTLIMVSPQSRAETNPPEETYEAPPEEPEE